MREKFTLLLGAGFVVAAFFYASIIGDPSMCWQVPVCPQIRSLILNK
jgi:hypothetical protein